MSPPSGPCLRNIIGGQHARSFNAPWWLVVCPGLAITVVVLAASPLGDGLRDFFGVGQKGARLSR